MALLYKCSMLIPPVEAMETGAQNTLIVISIIVVAATLAFAGYILMRNNKDSRPEDQVSLGDFFFISKDDLAKGKKPDSQPTEEIAVQPQEGNKPTITLAMPDKRTVIPLQISNMRIEPVKARPGELITIWFSATNLDSSQMQHEVTLKIDERVFNTRMISILPGTIQHLSFKVAITESGSYTADVNESSGIFIIGQ